MRIADHYARVEEAITNLLKAMRNALTAADNFGPEGLKGQVLTSNGRGPNDPPPSYKDIPSGITHGNGYPAAGVGLDGWYYLDVSTGAFYQKKDGAWGGPIYTP